MVLPTEIVFAAALAFWEYYLSLPEEHPLNWLVEEGK